MRNRSGGESETYHLTCPVCGALPGTSCLEDFQELRRIHLPRLMSVAERNRRHAASGWEPPELVERRLTNRDVEAASTPPLGLDPRAGVIESRAGAPLPGSGLGAGLALRAAAMQAVLASRAPEIAGALGLTGQAS
jgi:hypothetical protein